MSSRIVFDTETTSLDRPFAYDVGYIIIGEDLSILQSRSFVIEQIWHNLPLFESAYYKEKRPLYVKRMRAHESIMTKWGYMVSQMIRDIKEYDVVAAYAYNSNFDDKVFTFCCDWFKTRNPFDTIPIYDIWGYASQYITNTDEYKEFAEQHELFTDSGNYSGNAESVYKFITDECDFEEKHMGLDDVIIEYFILKEAIKRGASIDRNYTVNKILNRTTKTPYTIKVNGEIIHKGEYIKKYVRNGAYNFTEEMRE